MSWIEEVWELRVGQSLRISKLSLFKRFMLLLALLIILKALGDTGASSGGRMIVNRGRIVIDPITSFGNSYVLSAEYG